MVANSSMYRPQVPEDVTEPLLKPLDKDTWNGHGRGDAECPEEQGNKNSKLLGISFVAMVFIGLGNKVMQKVQTEPMKNYPFFLNMWTTFIFIPASFIYIVPMLWMGKLSPERKMVSQYKVNWIPSVSLVSANNFYLGKRG